MSLIINEVAWPFSLSLQISLLLNNYLCILPFLKIEWLLFLFLLFCRVLFTCILSISPLLVICVATYSPCLCLVFHFYGVLWCADVFNFNVVKLIHLFSYFWEFCVLLRKLSLPVKS